MFIVVPSFSAYSLDGMQVPACVLYLVVSYTCTLQVWPSGPSGSGSNLPIQPPAMLVPIEEETEKPAEMGDIPAEQPEVSVIDRQ